MTEPLPNCFSIWPSAALSAFLRLSSIVKSPLQSERFGERKAIKAGCINPQEFLHESLYFSMNSERRSSIQWPGSDDTVYRARLAAIAAHQHESIALHADWRRERTRPFA